MARKQSKPQDRLVLLHPRASEDLDEIYLHTTLHWGIIQAERYTAFLHERMLEVANSSLLDRPLADRPGLFVCFVRWKRSRYCHNIIYQRNEQGISVLRILHSAMDLPAHVDGGSE